MTRRPYSFFEEMIALISRLPWWLYLTGALLSFLFFHWYAGLPLGQGRLDDGFMVMRLSGGLRQGAVLAQYLVPLLFLMAALLAMYQKWKRDGLYDDIARNPSADGLQHMSRPGFHFVVAQYFSRRGFDISKVKVGAEIHAAFSAVKGREKYLVLCHSKQMVGVETLEELVGEVTPNGAIGGIAVSSMGFNEAATAFAKAHKINLLDGTELHRNIRSRFRPDEAEQRTERRVAPTLKWLFVLLVTAALGIAAWRLTATDGNLFTRITAQLQEIAVGRGWLGERERAEQNKKSAGDERIERYRYEIELHTGGWMHLDDAPRITEETISFQDSRGLDISLNRDEVKTIKRIRVDE